MRTIFRAKAQGGVTPREADRREAALRAAHAGETPIKLFPPSLIAAPIGGPAAEAHAEFVRQLNGAEHQDEIQAEAPPDAGGQAVHGLATEVSAPLPPEPEITRERTADHIGPEEQLGSSGRGLPLPRIIRDDGAPPDIWIKSADGLKRWRPIVDAWRIHELPEGGRLIEITGGRPLRLDGDLAAHFAWLMMPEEWRIALGERGVGR